MTSLVTFPFFIRYSVSFQQPAFFCMTVWSIPSSITAVPCWYLPSVPCWRADPVTRLCVLGRLLAKMYQPQEHGYFGASSVLSHATCGWLVHTRLPRMTFALLTVVSANYFLSFRGCVGKQKILVVLSAFCFLSFQDLWLWQAAEWPRWFPLGGGLMPIAPALATTEDPCVFLFSKVYVIPSTCKATDNVEQVIVPYLKHESELCPWKIGGLDKLLSFPAHLAFLGDKTCSKNTSHRSFAACFIRNWEIRCHLKRDYF